MNQTQQNSRSEEAEEKQVASLWARFAETDPGERDAFCQSWLALQSRMLTDVYCGMVLLKEPLEGAFVPTAVWPSPDKNITHLKPTAERALAERRGLLEPSQNAGDDEGIEGIKVAYPIEVAEQLEGVVVLEIAKCSPDKLQEAFRQLHWGIGWIELVIQRQKLLPGKQNAGLEGAGKAVSATASDQGPERARLELMLELVAAVVEEPGFKAAVMTLATELASVLNCDRASIGLLKGKKVKVQAISHTVQFGKNMNLVRGIEYAMEEALDQQATVQFPSPVKGIPLVTQSHQNLIKEHGGELVCSVPFTVDGEFAGVLTLERGQERVKELVKESGKESGEQPEFDEETLRLAQGVMELVGPVLITKRRDDRWLAVKAYDSAKEQLQRLFGPRHLGYKLTATIITLLVAFFAFAKGDYRVSADALLEGEVQRVVVAPQEGFVARAQVRAGDLVTEGQVMAELDERDLELERVKLASESGQFRKEYREALASADRAKVSILAAQNRQVLAKLSLIEEQLARLKLLAPFDGVVVSGDLSQSLGAPVERGEELFVVAPLESYRVVIKVDERQIADLVIGQVGQLALSSMPSEPIELEVKKITPVATTEEGRNYFRVEGILTQEFEDLRPGMQGVAKVNVDRRHLIWIWGRELINWVQLSVWKYLP